MSIQHHGTPGRYGQGCRCNLCVFVHARSNSTRPIPDSNIPADGVRDHIHALREAGWTFKRIAEESGYHDNTIRNLASGKSRSTSRFVVEDILSLAAVTA